MVGSTDTNASKASLHSTKKKRSALEYGRINLTVSKWTLATTLQVCTSVIGVSRTLSGPYLSSKPLVICKEHQQHKYTDFQLSQGDKRYHNPEKKITNLVCTLVLPNLRQKHRLLGQTKKEKM
jgi:hypothetical protein